jgi:TRAP-type uncharacterized transport system substrate-binding protein
LTAVSTPAHWRGTGTQDHNQARRPSIASLASTSKYVILLTGTYPSLTRQYQTVGLYNFAVAHGALPDDLVYAITEVVFTNHDEMMQIHHAAADTIPRNFTRNAILPFHGGAARWYRNKSASGVILGD